MKIKIWGCRGSIPRPSPEMVRYGGNTPCIEVLSSSRAPHMRNNGCSGCSVGCRGDDGHRIILDLGSGAFDLGQKVLGEMFRQKQKLTLEKGEKIMRKSLGEGREREPTQKRQKFGGSILITHTHWDHIQGLPFFVPLYLPQFQWTIYGPRGVAKSLHEALSGQMQHDYFPVRLTDMGSQAKYIGLSEDPNKGFWLGDEGAPTSIKVTSKYLNHSVLTLGYKLEEFAQIPQLFTSSSNNKRKRAKRGVSVAYITDHEPFDHALAKGGFIASSFRAKTNPRQPRSADETHAQFFKDVEIIFHDCQYLFSEYSPESSTSKEYWGHSTVEYVVEVAFYANVKQLLLFHHDPQRTDVQMDELVKYARDRTEELEEQYGDHMVSSEDGCRRRIPMKVDAAREGDVYELDPFVFMGGDDVDIEDANVLAVNGLMPISSIASNISTKQSVLLGLHQSEAGPICDVLKNSENAFSVKVLHNSDDVVQYSQEKQPSVIVLDERMIGSWSTGFEVCDEIRTNMGAWGKQVILLVIASSNYGQTQNDIPSAEMKQQQMADRLNLKDYIRGPFSSSYLLTRIQVSLLQMPLRWRRAPFSSRESQRLATLKSTGLLDSEPEERFDRITRLCSTMFKVPISAVSLVDTDRQWFKSNVGLSCLNQTPRDHAFCAHAILEDGIMVVPDALQDSRFADNPLVEGALKIRFYAGCPIRVSLKEGNGSKMPIGTLCVIDSKPRDLREEELRALKDLGAMVEREVSNFSHIQTLVSGT